MDKLFSEDHQLPEIIGKVVGIILGIALCALLGSCKSPCGVCGGEFVYITDTVHVNRIQHDSIHVTDSVYVKEWQKGDTVLLTTDRWHTRYKERISHDSIYIHLTDTVCVTVPVEVANKRSWLTKAKNDLGYMALGGMIALLCIAMLCWYKGK